MNTFANLTQHLPFGHMKLMFILDLVAKKPRFH